MGTPARSKFSLRYFIMLSVGLLIGCGGGDKNRVPVLPVKGKILLDGEPAVGAYVEFIQKNPTAATKNISPTSSVDENGDFLLSTYAMGDGIPEGNYHVLVRWSTPDEMTDMDTYPENWEYLSEVYGDSENPRLGATIQRPAEDEIIDTIVIPTLVLVSEEGDEYEE